MIEAIIVRLKTYLSEVEIYLYLLVEKTMFQSHGNLFSYTIIAILLLLLPLQSGII